MLYDLDHEVRVLLPKIIVFVVRADHGFVGATLGEDALHDLDQGPQHVDFLVELLFDSYFGVD